MLGQEKQQKTLSLKNEIWIYTTCYHGISYVTRLSSKPLKVFAALVERRIKLPGILEQIVLSMDCTGIRQIQCLDRDSHPVADGSPWYKVLKVKDADVEVRVDCRGLFVRDVDLASNKSSSALCNIWTSPFPPIVRPTNSHLNRVNPRLDYINFESHIKGLVVCCANGMNLGIHGFSSASRQFADFVSLMNRRAGDSPKHWIYFPFNKSESVEAAWVRKFEFGTGSASCPVLIVGAELPPCRLFLTHRKVTHLGRQNGHIRTSSSGQHSRALRVSHACKKKGDGTVTGIFHNGLDPYTVYITEFGVTCDGRYDGKKSKSLPLNIHLEPPPVPARRGSESRTWYMTKVSLKGLVKVRLCRDFTKSYYPCLGLLLTYNDRHVESLGQIRWDLDMSQEVVRPACIQRDIFDGRSFVKNVLSDETEGYESGEMVGSVTLLSQYDIIIWWFSHLGDKIVFQ